MLIKKHEDCNLLTEYNQRDTLMRDTALWNRIQNFEFNDKNAQFNFSQRLARDNNWTQEFADKVLEEYRKFIYLCCVAEGQITPSDAVDQAWHLHLTYTKSYWKDFCGETLGREIHHNPTKGGDAERSKFSDCYAESFKIYREEFEMTPPEDVWLSGKRRFGEINFRRINVDNYWMIKKPNRRISTILSMTFLLLLVPGLFIQAEGSSGLILLIFVAAIFIIYRTYGGGGKNGGGNNGSCSTGCSTDSGCSGCSGCGGCGGCGGCS